MIRFTRPLQGLFILVCGSDLPFFLDNLPGADVVLFILLLTLGSSPYRTFASDSSLRFVCSLRLGGYPYISYRRVVIASAGYYSCTVSHWFFDRVLPLCVFRSERGATFEKWSVCRIGV